MTHKIKSSLGVLNTFKSEKEFWDKKGLRTGDLYSCFLFFIILPSFFYLGPMVPYIRLFKVFSVLKNFPQFFILPCFSAMINIAYLPFLKILSSMTANSSGCLLTFLITPLSLSWVLFPGIFFHLSCLYMLVLKDIFPIVFLDLKSFSWYETKSIPVASWSPVSQCPRV